MSEYRKINSGFWIGDTGKRLRGDKEAQIVAMYLMTSTHSHMTGVYHCPIMYIAYETGLSIEGASKGLQRVVEEGFCTFDEASEYVLVHRMAAYQIGESLSPGDNRVKGLKKDVLSMPKGRIRDAFLSIYAEAFNLRELIENHKPLARGSEAPSKPEREAEAVTEAETVLLSSRAKSEISEPEPSSPPISREGNLCRQLREIGIDANPSILHASDWVTILAKRTDEQILEYAQSKINRNPNKRIGLMYLAPGLLEDPKPLPRASPQRRQPPMSAVDRVRAANPLPGDPPNFAGNVYDIGGNQ